MNQRETLWRRSLVLYLTVIVIAAQVAPVVAQQKA
jgi:hypothetical protein